MSHTLYPCSMETSEGQRTVERQCEILDEKIKNMLAEKDRLLKAEDSADAIICYGYDANYPTAVYIGDNVGTKYGDLGVVIAVDKEESSFTIKTEEDEIKSFCGSRLS